MNVNELLIDSKAMAVLNVSKRTAQATYRGALHSCIIADWQSGYEDGKYAFEVGNDTNYPWPVVETRNRAIKNANAILRHKKDV